MHMRRALALVVTLALLAAAAVGHAVGDPGHEGGGTGPGVDADSGMIPRHVAVSRAIDRFPGRVLDIAVVPPTPPERTAGIAAVYRLRLIVPPRDVLDIRMDASSGRFVDVRGANLAAARRGDRRRHEDDH